MFKRFAYVRLHKKSSLGQVLFNEEKTPHPNVQSSVSMESLMSRVVVYIFVQDIQVVLDKIYEIE